MLALCPYIYENCLFVHSHFDRFTSPMRNSFYEYYTYTYIISNKIRKTVEHRERQTERDRDTDRQTDRVRDKDRQTLRSIRTNKN